MTTTRSTLLLTGLVLVGGCAAVVVFAWAKRDAVDSSAILNASESTPMPVQRPAVPVSTGAQPSELQDGPTPPKADDSTVILSEAPAASPTSFPESVSGGAAPAPGDVQPLGPSRIPLETAREALALVGEDPAAEAVWIIAINDWNMSKHDRSDLIEDLNEEGFPETKDMTRDDLPKVLNRLALIERLAPDAMDETNAAAFAEAHKDLVNILKRLISP
ncbi:MAG TPA: hypothetical protein VMS30_02800 [Phycisphaerales bacterium]|nr:hypothetical protein [Phycisphaerales bacterium]